MPRVVMLLAGGAGSSCIVRKFGFGTLKGVVEVPVPDGDDVE